MLHPLRVVLSILALGCVLWPSGAQAGANFLATGWNGDGSDFFRGSGQGVYLSGGATTVYRFRAIRTAQDRALPYSPLWQSFHFVVRDDRARHRVSFETSVRGSTDFYRGGFAGEVLYAFVEVVPEGRSASMRAGRQLHRHARRQLRLNAKAGGQMLCERCHLPWANGQRQRRCCRC